MEGTTSVFNMKNKKNDNNRDLYIILTKRMKFKLPLKSGWCYSRAGISFSDL